MTHRYGAWIAPLGFLVVSCSSAVDLPLVPEPNPIPVIYGLCGLTPNYVGAVVLSGRFSEFPIAVHVDVSAASPNFETMYAQAIRDGVESWAVVSGDQVGSVRFVDDSAEAQVIVRFIPTIPGAPLAFASTLITDVRPGVRPILAGALIEISRQNMLQSEGLVSSGIREPDVLRLFVVGLAAHEFGHALGIQTHTGSGGPFLMAVDGFDRHVQPTVGDMNTVRDNYCRA